MQPILPTFYELEGPSPGTNTRATFVELSGDLAKEAIDKVWWHFSGPNPIKRADGDSWDWAPIAGAARINKWAEVIGLQTAEGDIQGAIGYWTNGKSLLEHGLGSVFVEHFATAPRNRPWIVGNAAYRGVGTGLMLYTVCHSYMLGLGGRVTLVSLPTEHAVRFYRNRGFSELATLDDGKIEFELATSQARAWLRDEGIL